MDIGVLVLAQLDPEWRKMNGEVAQAAIFPDSRRSTCATSPVKLSHSKQPTEKEGGSF